jgi:CRISPR-associated endonuclease/helicase Cas3
MTFDDRHFAHSLPPPSSQDVWEPLSNHLERVASGDGEDLVGAAGHAEVFGAAEWGRLLGLWHDLGKYSDEFQNYLRASAGIFDGAIDPR